MKTKIFALAFTLVASSAFAQNAFNPYRLAPMAKACNILYNPYNGQHGTSSVVCNTPKIEGGAHVTYTIVQGSVGIFGREIAFLNLMNPTNEINHAVIEYTIDGKEGTFYQHLFLMPKERYSIGLHTEAEFKIAPAEWNFSVMVQFQKPGAIEMVWYRASDNAEVDSKPGQEVR
jgi:hypothetical protein